MVDRQFSDARLAELYDLFCPWEGRGDFAFYLPMIMSAKAVLDVGCGTGALLHGAREAGHTGRLCGLDPAAGMLAQAWKRSGVEWVQGDLASATWQGRFDLIIMTGHAFQVLITDDEIAHGLAAIRAALTEDGRFAFETRNPLAREWERWIPDNATEVTDAHGTTVRLTHEVTTPVTNDLVTFTSTYTSPGWDRPRVSRSTLRFLSVDALNEFLSAAGLAIEDQFGDWDRRPLSDIGPEIITVTRRSLTNA